MTWTVALDDDFLPEFEELSEAVHDELLALLSLLETFGPQLGHPPADTLKGSDYANMKELRCEADNQAWRFAFAFDPERTAVILCGGRKSGKGQSRFYTTLIDKAYARYAAHLARLKKEKRERK